ncbi:Protein mono-ADP-ribosyltransferase PARP14 [Frankliniella fusca]|uniref:Poly [ADP-ribose] polymerase n=1 Tax=Frankliniella fusca TaxID=407009 RepID=A0AAE1H0B9_9NEOP|nr:Protein mono-ADP-ribosyltransferase PARP14 [Frankliniella fusca]
MGFNPYEQEEDFYWIPRYYKHLIPDYWNVYGYKNNQVSVLERLYDDDEDWDKIDRKMGPRFDVVQIWTIQNPRTYGRYAKKMEKYEDWYDREPKRWELFHGTQAKNVESIIDNNFDLRNLHTKDSSFYAAGEGVYFTNKAAYADWAVGGQNTRCYMFYCEVLIDKIKNVSNPNSVRLGPPARPGYETEVARVRSEGGDPHPSMLYDTTSRTDKDEYVKFKRNEYYPTHLIMYDRCY